MGYRILLAWLCVGLTAGLFAQSITDKIQSLGQGGSDLDEKLASQLKEINSETARLKEELGQVFMEAKELKESGGSPEEFQELVKRARSIRVFLVALQEQWRRQSKRSGSTQDRYALWHQPATTVEQLIIDYGSQDFVYILPEDIAGKKISLASKLAIPRESWQEMLEFVLSQMGVSIRQLNPYARELYLTGSDGSKIQTITSNMDELEMLPPAAGVGFLLKPGPAELKRSYQLLEKFRGSDELGTKLHIVGPDILIFSTADRLKQLLKLYYFVKKEDGGREYKLVGVSRGSASELAKVLETIFYEKGFDEKEENPGQSPFRAVAMQEMGESIFLLGSQEEVKRGEEILKELEAQVGDVAEKTVYVYQVRHSDPEEVATVLDRVYKLMLKNKIVEEEGEQPVGDLLQRAKDEIKKEEEAKRQSRPNADEVYDGGYSIVVKPSFVDPSKTEKKVTDTGRENFIVDAKAGVIIMVVEPGILPRLKELIGTLDVPKKMVRIDVVLFEKRLSDSNAFGLSSLAVGSSATNTDNTGFSFNSGGLGISNFLLNRAKDQAFAAFDLAFRFLLFQEDIKITANPSVTTLNRTPATVNIVEEISINTGAVEFGEDNSLRDSFARAQYGITIEVTPTIHMAQDEIEGEGVNTITLDTNITFSTPRTSNDDRPPVDTRAVKNQVRIADGQTLIIGGLRRKIQEDSIASVPFFSDIPGIGKLFTNTNLSDTTTEIFIFVKPTIIANPEKDYEKVRRAELCKRPGDTPEFIRCLEEARENEKRRYFENTMKMLFGRSKEPELVEHFEGEYDGS